MLSNGLGASVLAFFGDRGPVVECWGCSEWSGVSRLGGGMVRGWSFAVSFLRGCEAGVGF